MPCYTINQGLTAFFNEINMLMNANFSGHMRMTLKNILAVVMAGVVVVALGGCRGAKLSVANEQFERGEYFDAQKTYRKVYNKLTKKEQRLERGGVAYQMGLCYDKLGMRHVPPRHSATPCATVTPTARHSSTWGRLYRPRGNTPRRRKHSRITCKKTRPQPKLKTGLPDAASHWHRKDTPHAMSSRTQSCSIRAAPTSPRCSSTRQLRRAIFHHHQREGYRLAQKRNHRHEEERRVDGPAE